MRTGIMLMALASMAFTGCKQDASKKVKSENVAQAAERDEALMDMAKMSWDKTEYDFGTVNEGEKVNATFTVTNTGDSPLTIISAKASCGCTVADWPKDKPILPGESADIAVAFDSKNKPNRQQKTVTITANTEEKTQILRIKGFVTPDPELEKEREERNKQAEERRKQREAEMAKQQEEQNKTKSGG